MKKILLFHSSLYQLNGKIINYTFLLNILFHVLTIKQAIESVSGYYVEHVI